MLENMHFSYDGKSTKDFGVVMVYPDSGLIKESFLPTRKITEIQVGGRHNPFFQRVDDDPLSFSLTLYLTEWRERNNLRQIARWLHKEYYKPLIFESNSDVIYYAMVEGTSELMHDGDFNGYITVNFRLNCPYPMSIPHENTVESDGSATVEIYNNGDLPMRMKMEITMKADGNITITDETTGNAFELTDLMVDETVYVDCINEYIVSSLEERLNRYLLDNHNDEWLTIEAETSANLTITGNASVKFIYQYVYLNVDIEL